MGFDRARRRNTPNTFARRSGSARRARAELAGIRSSAICRRRSPSSPPTSGGRQPADAGGAAEHLSGSARVNPCPTCPLGFLHLSSDGSSMRNAAQLQIRRRLRNGFTATLPVHDRQRDRRRSGAQRAQPSTARPSRRTGWTSTPNAPAPLRPAPPAGGAVSSTPPASAWPAARSSTACKGSLLKGWTFISTLTTGSGLPLTPTYLTSVPGTGMTGTIAADLTGAPAGRTAGRHLR